MVYYLLIIKLGSISLNDLELCREFFLNQNINLEIVQSHLNSFKLKIPWRSLKEKVYFIFYILLACTVGNIRLIVSCNK